MVEIVLTDHSQTTHSVIQVGNAASTYSTTPGVRVVASLCSPSGGIAPLCPSSGTTMDTCWLPTPQPTQASHSKRKIPRTKQTPPPSTQSTPTNASRINTGSSIKRYV